MIILPAFDAGATATGVETGDLPPSPGAGHLLADDGVTALLADDGTTFLTGD